MNVFLKKIICLALMLMAVMADSAQSRTDVQLNDGWTIRPISDPSPGKQGTLVTLSHTWNANYVKGTFYNRETMVYTRSLNVSNEMLREHRVFLRFEGVNSVADVFVNRSTNASAESLNAKIKDFRAQLRGVIDKKFFIFRLVKIFG